MALTLGAVPASGAERPQDDLQEVVVSANRAGEQRLQDIPMAVSALATDDLAAQGLVAMEDFLRSVPGVTLDAEQSGLNRILMRGLVSTGLDYTQIQDRSLVAVYLDETPITLNTSNPDLRVTDLERVEVIRGPQGTLYGAGSMAGTVRYITRKPDAAAFSGLAEAQVSSTSRGGTNWNVKGSVNLPIVTDRLALRLGAYQEDQEGYVDNVGTGERDANTVENTQASVALRWLPTEPLTVDASVIYQQIDRGGSNGVYRELGDRFTSLSPVGFEDDLKIFNLTLGYDAGAVRLISSTSYLDREFELTSSFDWVLDSIFGFPFASPSVQRNTIENFTQEIRAVAERDRLRWQVGAFYGNDKRRYVQNSFAFGLDALLGFDSRDLFAPFPDEIYFGDIQVEDKQWALFGEGTYDLTEKLAITAGLRYFDFEGPADFFQGGLAGTDAFGLPVAAKATEEADGVNPKLVVSYKPTEDLLFFAEAARGFRYGGVNYPVPESFCAESLAAEGLTSAPLTFGPDKVWSYSIGEKWTSASRRALLNATAFFIEWSDAQTLHPLDCGYPFLENVGQIKSRGIELESAFRLTASFMVSLNATYTNAESDGPIDNIQARDGDRVPFFPEWTGAISAEYLWRIATGELTLSAGYTYRGETATNFNPNVPSYRTIPSSGVVNAAVSYALGPWQIGLFGTNLTDEDQVFSVSQPISPNEPGDLVYLGRPRTIGLRLQRKF